jgi:acyl dehydratase
MIESLYRLAVGDLVAESLSQPLDRATLQRYAAASGDLNPLHLDPAFARQAGFPDVIVHGMLGMAMLGRLLSDCLPAESIIGLRARFVAVMPVDSVLRCQAWLQAREGDTAVLSLQAGIDGMEPGPAITGRASVRLPPRQAGR